jgi:uncharacterized protein YegL
MDRVCLVSRLKVALAVVLLLSFYSLSGIPEVKGVHGTVVTTKTITPSLALPGQSLTVKINITISGLVPGGGPVDSCLVIDRTGSMFGQKFVDAKDAAKTFVDEQNASDRSMIIEFAEQARVRMNFTTTNDAGKIALKQSIDSIISPYGFTNLYAVLQMSVDEVIARQRPEALSAILLLTDGRPTIGITETAKFVEQAQRAADNGIAVYTIGLGGPSVPDPVNETLLRMIATAGNGKYYFAPTSSQLEEIYLTISAEIHKPDPAVNVRITERLPTSIVTYNNDATEAPTTVFPNGTIFWLVPQVTSDQAWVATFTVTALKRVAVVQSLSPTTIIYDRAESIDIRVDLPPGMAVREVATISMASNATSVSQGDTVHYNATVANYGTISESFAVGLFVNRSRISTATVSLANGTTRLVDFNWNTSSFNTGLYNVSIVADPDQTVFGDDPTNNTRTIMTTVGPRYETSILPLLMMVIIPLAIIPLVAAALLGRRRGYFSRMAAGTVTGAPVATRTYPMVCPRCYRQLTYYPNLKRWYCQPCQRYV